jgi:hypothetical protein
MAPDSAAPPLTPARALGLAAAAAAVHGAFDALASVIPGCAPPYLRLADASDAFKLLSPFAVSAASSCVSGAIGAMMAGALEPGSRRAVPLATLVTGFWLFSALLSWYLWFATPWAAALPGLLAGLPRGAVVGLVLARLGGPRRLAGQAAASASPP